MACRLDGAKPLPETTVTDFHLDHREQIFWLTQQFVWLDYNNNK